MDMILKTTYLCKSFKGQMAVNNVSLNIQRNSIYGLLGLPDKRIDEELRELIRSLQDKEITVILSSHMLGGTKE